MQPNWKPLETALGVRRCAGFMYMGRVNGIHLYKHGIVRLYLALDDHGRCYRYRDGKGYEPADLEVEVARIESALRDLDETFESAYDEAYIARKREALRRAGIPMVRIEIEPEEVTIH